MLKVGSALPSVCYEEEWPFHNSPGQFPLLVHFWSISCPGCKVNMPALQELRDTYGPRGLKTIAIHMPRGEAELDAEKVLSVIEEIGVTEPCALDNEHTLKEAFGAHSVPFYFLFDADGKMRRQAVGNFGVRMIGEAVKRLIGEEPGEMPVTTLATNG